MEFPTLETFLGFSAVASLISIAVTQCAKWFKLPPRTVMLILSVLGGVIYWVYFLIPEASRLWISGAVGTIFVGGSLIYKILLQIFPELSSKYTPEQK